MCKTDGYVFGLAVCAADGCAPEEKARVKNVHGNMLRLGHSLEELGVGTTMVVINDLK